MTDDGPLRLKTYYRTKQPRLRIQAMLRERGSMNIKAILERYNRTWKHGLTMNQLTNILAGDCRFVKTGHVPVFSVTGNRYKVTVWEAS